MTIIRPVRLYGTSYSIWLLSPTGQRLRLIDRFEGLQYTLTSNGIGVLKLELTPDFDLDLVQEDSRLEVYRQVPGGGRYLDGEAVWLIRDWDEIVDSQGREMVALLAYSAAEILDRAIIGYASGSSQASKSSVAADDMMKAFVRENLGSLATDSDRDRSAWLVVEVDEGAGPTTSKSAAWRRLLPTLRDLAQDSDELGTPVFFDVVRTPGASTMTFKTYVNQRGTDHGLASDQPVVLSPRRGTLGEVRRSYVSSEERNAIYTGGQGQGSDREVVEVENSSRVDQSPLNRREYFVDARNSSSTAGLTAEGQTALESHRPREIFSATIRDTQAVRYGREYRFGDRLAAELKGRAVNCRLDGVEITVRNGEERIRAELRVDA